jgi:hypothetical protein
MRRGIHYQSSIVDRPHTFLQLPIEEISEAGVVGQVGMLDFIQVTAENECVKLESIRTEPYWQFKRVKISP